MADVIKTYQKKKQQRIQRAIWQVERWINAIGIDEAFKIVGTTLIYSGPRESISEDYAGCSSNHERTYDQFNKIYNSLLDETYIGNKTYPFRDSGLNIYAYFLAEAFVSYKDKDGQIVLSPKARDLLKDESDSVADAVMEHVSKRFIDHAHGDVETCVCGADFNRVFYKVEMPALMANDKITKINGVPKEELKKIYLSGDKNAVYNTYTEICRAELEMIHSRAMNAKDEGTKNFWLDDYQGRRKFFELEQNETGINPVIANDDMPSSPSSMRRKMSGSSPTVH